MVSCRNNSRLVSLVEGDYYGCIFGINKPFALKGIDTLRRYCSIQRYFCLNKPFALKGIDTLIPNYFGLITGFCLNKPFALKGIDTNFLGKIQFLCKVLISHLL